MKITSLASSSAGNCYILESKDTKIMLECGIPLIRICRGLYEMGNLTFTSIKGCLISHGHRDHARYMNEINYYIPIYGSVETVRDAKNSHEISSMVKFIIGDIGIIPFDVEHDCGGILGFVLKDSEDTILFATDCSLIKYKFPFAFTKIMIECNYVDDFIDFETLPPQDKRRINTHMGLKSLITHLGKMDLSHCQEIIAIHLSDSTSGEEIIRQRLFDKFGIPIKIAGKNGGIS